MKQIKKPFFMYTIDFWIFIILIVVLTALIQFINVSFVSDDTIDFAKKSYEQSGEKVRQDVFLYSFSLAVLICIFLIQPNKKLNASPLTWLSLKAGQRLSTRYTLERLNNFHACVLTLSALIFIFGAYTISAVILGRKTVVLTALLVTLIIIFISFGLCVMRGISEKSLYLLIGICFVFPVAITILEDNLNIGHTPNTYIWLIAGITFCRLLLNRMVPQLFFKFFTISLYIGILFELYFVNDIDFLLLLNFSSNTFYVGFIIFALLDFRTERFLENYTMLESINNELVETQTQLIQKEQMVTLGQLIAGVAHEINTPVGAIKASSELLGSINIEKFFKDSRRYDDDALEVLIAILDMCVLSTKSMRSTRDIRRGKSQVRQFMDSIDINSSNEICAILADMEICDVEKIETNMDIFRRGDIMDILKSARALKPYISSIQNISFASNGITKIIFALKSFSHMNTTGEKQQFDIIKSLDNVLVLYHNQIKRGIELIKQYDEDIPLIFGNVEELTQVWTNILQNAIYAMSYVGRLIISVKSSTDRKVLISFTDTGTGISPENLEKLFVPFFTTKPLGEGSGLGLDICKKIIEKHDGKIEVESRVGQGTTFTVTLPSVEYDALKSDSRR